MKIIPIKSLGQNYLNDQNIIRKIIDEIDIMPDDRIIEIGPGLGALTKEIYKKTEYFTAIDIDTRVSGYLKEHMPSLNIIITDFLKVDLNEIIKFSPVKIAGNIPYNITSPILFKLIENRELISEAVLMVQHEVAKRICGKQGTKDYGILSVILSYVADVNYCFKVSANVFHPKPNVDSAVIHLRFKKELEGNLQLETFKQVVKASFGNRRKTLKNSLSNSIFHDYELNKLSVDLTKRAEQLSLSDFIMLTAQIQKLIDDRKNRK
ncbi:MAG: ribosomal RNA small subunit methyltransferase A [Bacteroidetes bacterium]|nr:ribosomal RNA small subunit methyltransferase A [Bacteroidota bacterium]